MRSVSSLVGKSREMIPDGSRPLKDGVIWVKSSDGGAHDPTFDRVLSYTIEGNPTEFKTRTFKGDTAESVRASIQGSHPEAGLGLLTFEGADFDDSDPLGEWASRTGTTDLRVLWKKLNPIQKLWLWTPEGEVETGEVELRGQPESEIWQSLRSSTPTLEGRLIQDPTASSW
jgi:hypothetical protein